MPAKLAAVLERYEPVIGIEVHIELQTESKIFCGCATRFGAEPNTQVCPVCLGLPGVLPVLNERVVEFALRAALALGCRVPVTSQFARKNYFYPDLPKGYQISQFERSLAYDGELAIEADLGPRRVTIGRINIEEEAAKSLHGGADGTGDYSLIDFNRGGVPLIEIVSGPDLRSPEEARAYLGKLRNLILYTGISDCRMQEGSFRFDANVSLRPVGSEKLGDLAELKNLNSFRHVVRALEYEIVRQGEVLDGGGSVVRETRTWDEASGRTVSMRSKEQSDDYRYFPEPDLVLLRVDEARLERVRAEMPELPEAVRARLVREYGLSDYLAGVLVADREMAGFFDAVVAELGDAGLGVVAANWVAGDLASLANAAGLEFGALPVGPGHLADLVRLVAGGKISGKMAKELLAEIWEQPARPSELVAQRGLAQVSDAGELGRVVAEVLAGNPEAVAALQAGKERALGFLVGQVMKATRGQAHPGLANELIRAAVAKLDEER